MLPIVSIYILWVLLPLVPSILIYRIFPDTHLVAKGPFAALTLNASGAFAGYLLIFAGTAYQAASIETAIVSQSNANSYFRVTAPVQAIDEDARSLPINPERLQVSLKPIEWQYSDGEISTFVRRSDGIFPILQVTLGGVGGGSINLASENISKIIDNASRTIKVQQPITIRRYAGFNFGG